MIIYNADGVTVYSNIFHVVNGESTLCEMFRLAHSLRDAMGWMELEQSFYYPRHVSICDDA